MKCIRQRLTSAVPAPSRSVSTGQRFARGHILELEPLHDLGNDLLDRLRAKVQTWTNSWS
jgi:hypothetical protein